MPQQVPGYQEQSHAMKISDARTFVVANPPPHHGGLYWVFVKLTSDSGISGYGEAYSVPFHPRVVAQMIEDVCDRHVIGSDPFKIERLWRIVYSSGYTQRPDTSIMGVLSAIEIACWDIVGKELGKPVYELLGGQIHESLRSYTYLYPKEGDEGDVYRDPDLAAKRALEYADQGFTAVKFDPVGPYSAFDPRQLSLEALDRAEIFVSRIREAVGSRCDLDFRQPDTRSGGQPVRSPVRHPRSDDHFQRHPACPAPRALRSPVVRGAGAAGERRRDGAGGAIHQYSRRHRRAPGHQVRVCPGAGQAGGVHPATGPG
jgi:2-dehydro-3-deoxyphosphogalactonate aldolase